MYIPQPCEDSDPFLAELIQFSSHAAVKKNPRQSIEREPKQVPAAHLGLESETAASSAWDNVLLLEHAAPLMPMNQRDLTSLVEIFESTDMAEVETDIAQNLLLRWPEPCWDDNLLEFLEEFL